MLDHVLSLTGPSVSPAIPLRLSTGSLLVHATADTLVLSDASSLSLIRILAFWEAFPGSFDSESVVRSVSVNQERKLIAASTGTQVAIWIWSETADGLRLKVHSTLVVRDDVTSIDCKAGFLALGTIRGFAFYHLDDEADVPRWVRGWNVRIALVSCIALSPAQTHIACVSESDPAVHIFDIRTRLKSQRIRHPQPPSALLWRVPPEGSASREDLILFTWTPDYTVRIYFPVLDAPGLLQLHATVDRFSFHPDPLSSQEGSRIFWLDKEIITNSLKTCVASDDLRDEVSERRKKRLQEVLDGSLDVFARVMSDGSIALRAVANIERRPPTLLRQFNILHATPRLSLDLRYLPTDISVHASPKGSLILVSSPPFRSYMLHPLSFFDGEGDGLEHLARSWDPIVRGPLPAHHRLALEKRINSFVRSPEGNAIVVNREGSSRELWALSSRGRLKLMGPLDKIAGVDDHVVCMFGNGRTVALYSATSQKLVVQHFPPEAIQTHPISQTIDVKTTSRPVLFSLPPVDHMTPIVCATSSSTHIVYVTVSESEGDVPKLSLTVQLTEPLPVDVPPDFIMPVDPMMWTLPGTEKIQTVADTTRDAFVSLSPTGELAFWAATGLRHAVQNTRKPVFGGWKCTGRVHTDRKGISIAQCSSAKKTVLVVPTDQGQEVTIWDSIESEFSSGLEYRHLYSERLNDLDWTSTNDAQSILALGFQQKVRLLCPQRMSYFDERPTWGVFWEVDVSTLTPYSISDSIWLAGGNLLVGTGHQMFLFGQKPSSGTNSPDQTEAGLFEEVARQNGPLDDFHPQLILQCLLWNKVELVKEIITLLAHNLEVAKTGSPTAMKRIDVSKFWEDGEPAVAGQVSGRRIHHFSFLMNGETQETDDEEGFTRHMVETLVHNLEEHPLPHLTPSEMEHLIILIQTALEIDEQRRSLDGNGLRYLISIRSFFFINRRVTQSDSSKNNGARSGILAPFVRERIRYRDIIWAFHSESQEILMSASTTACGGKMMWLDARALGVFLWGTSNEMLRSQMEVIARNQYMAGESRDPTACCLFYFALGKVKLVHGLWKQAAWHKEQMMMLKFLSNDFSEARWRTAALKNAFALLSKQRFEYAAAFFLLGGSLKDAVNVCLKQLSDFQLAVALARVVEGGDEGPVLNDILKNHVIPRAFREGNRWLGSWAFWMMHRRDLAVRILLTPLRSFVAFVDAPITDVGEPHYDDPSLAILFSQLKAKSLQTVKGTSEISGSTEFNFVLQMVRVLCRMGCHVLALDLVRSWSFDRPTMLIPPPVSGEAAVDVLHDRLEGLTSARDASPAGDEPLRARSRSRSRVPPSPTMRKSMLLMRRTSLIIDMDIPSLPPTAPTSPPEPALLSPPAANGSFMGRADGTGPAAADAEARGREMLPDVGNSDSAARQAGLGSLLKNAKKDVVVPEFDMANFF
ncbi:regulator of (H+)-ATPase in vacuolar membrane [Tulasnella sp. 418]|nr:regulator of (H+)-ATPase in vacuolar membrane [Tulasnella sp. 418]